MEPSKLFRRFVMELDNIRLGKRIKAARKRRGLSQLALSETLDCTPNHLSYIENGNRSLSLAKFVQLANALGASADELLMDSLDNTTEWYNEGKNKMYRLQTLVLPLAKAGQFKSAVKNLKVYNYER